MSQYRRFRDWIPVPGRVPSRSARLIALKIFVQSRLYRVRELLADKGELPSTSQVLALQEESQALAEVQRLEREESGEAVVQDREMDIWAAVHATLLKSFSSEAVRSGLITDAELRSSIIDCDELITRYHNDGNLARQYQAIVQLMKLTWQRFVHFKTVAPESVMSLVYRADDLFTEIRNMIVGLDPSEGLAAKAQLSEEFFHREHYNFALVSTLTSFDSFVTQARSEPTKEVLRKISQSFLDFQSWALRSKGRGFADILNLEMEVPRTVNSLEAQLDQQSPIGKSINDEDDKSQDTIMELGNKFGATDLREPSPIKGATATKEQINEMLESLPKGVVLVDFIDVRYGADSTSFVAIIYRKGQANYLARCSNINIHKINRWVEENMDNGETGGNQLDCAHALKALENLGGLLKPLISPESQAGIRPGETVIFCPTGTLNRIPIHAIPVDGKPFIERNPVAYCQSLSILRWLWLKHQNQSMTAPHPKCTVINPMPDFWKNPRTGNDGEPVMSKESVANIARDLHADFHHGLDLNTQAILKAAEGSSILHYHGHVEFNPRSALDSAMVFEQKDGENKTVTAREFFGVQLGDSALATIIGCGSGVTAISSTDDVLGLPTALFYAGAGAMVSTLWPIDDVDGSAFATHFYGAIREQRMSVVNAAVEVNAFDLTVDLAQAMQTAILKLRTDPKRKNKQAPYHWAGFTLNGLWMLPERVFPEL